MSHTFVAPSQIVADALAALPDGFAVADVGDAVAVAGPSGVFLVSAGGRDPLRTAAALSTAARDVRATLAERMAPAPLVEAVIVADGPCPPSPRASVIPSALVVDALLDAGGALDGGDVAAAISALRSLRVNLS